MVTGSAGPVVVAHGAVPFAIGRSVSRDSADPVVVTHGGAPFSARRAVVAGVSGTSCCHARRRLLSRLGGRCRGIQRIQLLSRIAAAPFASWRAGVVGVQRDQLLSRIAGGSLHGSTGDGRRNSTSPVVVTHSSGSFRELTAVVAGIQRVQLLSRTTAAPFRIDGQHSARSASPVVVAHGSCSPPPRTFRAVVSAVSASPVVVAHREPPFRIPDSLLRPIHQLLSRTVGTSSHLRRPKSRPRVETARETEVTEEPSSCCRALLSPPFQSRAFGGFRTSSPVGWSPNVAMGTQMGPSWIPWSGPDSEQLVTTHSGHLPSPAVWRWADRAKSPRGFPESGRQAAHNAPRRLP